MKSSINIFLAIFDGISLNFLREPASAAHRVRLGSVSIHGASKRFEVP
ncbi:hypothetical protein [Metallibacterium sp.]|nr:hypothetical protein [Metallibacterium sp.]